MNLTEGDKVTYTYAIWPGSKREILFVKEGTFVRYVKGYKYVKPKAVIQIKGNKGPSIVLIDQLAKS